MRKFLLAAATLVAAPVSAQQATAPAQNGVTSGAGSITTAPVATSADVASIVAREFPSYDRDRDGSLNQNEFGEWMVKLKTIADPNVRADAPSTKTWLNAAFAQADSDKSRSLTLGELTGFLSPA
ncbi:calcium-binding protein [Sphingomonas lenta]|uniref:Calcium-binding protein n=1 Tax=Sphingomonas lenta TaxID=1141887 RepID=A0A2A2SJI8_9SPHN|nr:calcium-binding protein [Sphingomonas lenta]PAX09402.1 calcium-binding protein [Sphingomonas lenta]